LPLVPRQSHTLLLYPLCGIGSQTIWLDRQRSGDADALALPAGEFAPVARHHGIVETNKFGKVAQPIPATPVRNLRTCIGSIAASTVMSGLSEA
jgi:hypothetical protein